MNKSSCIVKLKPSPLDRLRALLKPLCMRMRLLVVVFCSSVAWHVSASAQPVQDALEKSQNMLIEVAVNNAGPGSLEKAAWIRPAESAAVLASDPLESINRAVFGFNDQLDRRFVKPIASAYLNTVPRPLREGFGNMLLNLDDLVSLVNQLLQGKPSKAAVSLARFIVNSSIGIVGFFDVATESGLYHETEDLGQTFAVWGMPSGPYLVLPLLGPSTVRDASARVLFQPFSPIRQINPSQTRYVLIAGSVVSGRAELLEASQSSGLLMIDRYLFARDAFLQRRRSLIFDGDPPE